MARFQKIPFKDLRKLTVDRIDFAKETIIDDTGRLWTDIQVYKPDLDKFVEGTLDRNLRVRGKRAVN